MLRVLATLTLLVASATAFSQTPSERIEEFLRQVATPESDTAMDRLLAGSGFSESRPQDVVALKSQTKMAMGLYGVPLGIEKIREEDLSPSLKRLVYLQKFEKYPVAWEFYFYRAKDVWVVNIFNMKDQIGPLVGAKQ